MRSSSQLTDLHPGTTQPARRPIEGRSKVNLSLPISLVLNILIHHLTTRCPSNTRLRPVTRCPVTRPRQQLTLLMTLPITLQVKPSHSNTNYRLPLPLATVSSGVASPWLLYHRESSSTIPTRIIHSCPLLNCWLLIVYIRFILVSAVWIYDSFVCLCGGRG